jgi:alpha-beta hydrolase superfamily lysophospholipase
MTSEISMTRHDTTWSGATADVHAKAPEEPLHIRLDDADLRAVLHRAVEPARGAVMICAPDGEERSWAFRPLVQLARVMALRGQHVLRFDYEGQGESSGLYEDTDVASRLRDIRSAAGELRERSGFADVTVVAARLGGALALEAAAAEPAIRRIALWEPVLDVEGYVRNLLRVNVTTQMVVHKKVMRNSEQLLQDMAAGEMVSVNGYKLSHGFVTALQALNAGKRLTESKLPVLIIASAMMKIPDSKADVRRRVFGPFWKEPKSDMTPPQLLLKELADWVESAAGGGRQ